MSQDPQEQLEQRLKKALVRLEKAYDSILQSQPYNTESEKLKILIELAREQVPYENSHSTTRETW